MRILPGNARRRSLSFPLLFFLCTLLFLHLLPAAGTPRVRFAVIGDSGTGDDAQHRVARQMLAWHERLPYDLVLMLGDNIYGGFLNIGGGNKNDFEERFDRPYAGLVKRGVVFRAALGNHDMNYREGRDLIEDHDRFHIDGPLGYYTFSAGEWTNPAGQTAPLVDFFVLNTERLVGGRQDPAQLAWLEQALTGSRARWRIVYGHHPAYSAAHAHASDVALRMKLAPILAGPDPAWPRVQVVFAGHDHIYQRFRPQGGIVYFVDGSSGQLRAGDARPSSLVAAVEDEKHVFMLWEATPAELHFRAIDEDGRAFDCGVIPRAGEAEEVACGALAAGRAP